MKLTSIAALLFAAQSLESSFLLGSPDHWGRVQPSRHAAPI
jgi:hypothetical protein